MYYIITWALLLIRPELALLFQVWTIIKIIKWGRRKSRLPNFFI